MNHLAIYRAYPNATLIDDGIGVLDAAGNKIEIDAALVAAAASELAAEHAAVAYRAKREVEYPDLAELADAMYWSSKGDNTKLEEYYAACEAVKAKYPKPTGGAE